MSKYHRVATAVLFAAGAILFAWAGSPRAVQGEPYMALRTGLKCSHCHFNRTGGGKRTDFGVIYSQTSLPMKPVKATNFFDGWLSRSVSVGANLRFENVSQLPYTNTLGEEGEGTTNNRIPEANVYVAAELVPDFLTAYLDQTFAPTSANREFFGLVQFRRFNSYLKVGRMLLPYGFRIRDDDAFIRDKTGFTYSKHDIGLEFGMEPGRTSMMVNLTRSQISMMGQYIFRRFRVGASFSQNIRGSIDYKMGMFAGFSFGRLTVAAEGDFIRISGKEQFAGLVEVYALPMAGLNVRAAYEFYDRRRDVPNSLDGRDRITIGVEPFITQFLQIGVYYRINRFIPQNVPLNQDQLIVQFHVFF